jgi:hypothetical protein
MRNNNDIFKEDSIQKEAPLLASIPKRNPYIVPEGYFDELPSVIMENCRKSIAVPEKTNKISWLLRPQWLLALFAGLVGIVFFMRKETNVSYETMASKVSDSAIYQNLQANIDYVDVNTLEDAVQTENITPLDILSDSTNNRQEMVNYLMNHNIDASDIEDEL